MTNLDSAWRDLQRCTDRRDAALQAQIDKVERLRSELMAEIRKLERMLAHD